MTPDDDPLRTLQPTPSTDSPRREGTPSTFAPTPPPLSYQTISPPAPPDPDLPNIPGYELLGVLGRGGMGVVYQARDVRLGHRVAIKLPLDHCLSTVEHRERFLQEARAAAGLRHPNICTIHRVDEHQGRPFIVMACVNGESLHAWQMRKSPTARECADMIARLARAVQYAHEHEVIHRDLKPANVMVDAESGQPVLMDFGLAKDLARQDVHFTQTGQLLGTPAFMAPEQASGKAARVGPPADVYSLGGVLYHLLCGLPPFPCTLSEVPDKVQHEDPVPLRRLNANVHRDLEVICLKALAKDPAARYPTALGLAEDLERFCAGEPIRARPEGFVARLWRKARRNAGVTAAIAAVALATVVVLLVVAGAARRSALRDLADEVATRLDDEAAWTSERVEAVEGRIDALAASDPDAGDRMRQRLHERIAAWLGRLLSEPTLERSHHEQITAGLDLLAARDPSRGAVLRQAYEERLRHPEVFLDLKAPFTRLAGVFAPDDNRVRVEDGKLALREERGRSADVPVLTRLPARANVRLEATFDDSWEKGTRAGLLLGTGDASGTKGYALVLHTPGGGPAERDKGKPPTFADIRARNGWLSLQILKNGLPVVEQRVRPGDLPPGPLHVEAKRAGDRLTCQVGGLPPLVFQDLFPLTGDGVCGLYWPEGARLQDVRGSREALSARPSPLERGDELYLSGKFAEALAQYRRQVAASPVGTAGQEARLKEGMALAALGRLDDAGEIFERLAPKQGERWPYLAACQLWVVRVRQKRLADAESILDTLLARQPAGGFDRLAVVLPREVLEKVVGDYADAGLGVYSVYLDPQWVVRLERASEVARLLGVPWSQRGWNDLAMIRGYRMAGRTRQAVRATRERLDRDEPDSQPVGMAFLT